MTRRLFCFFLALALTSAIFAPKIALAQTSYYVDCVNGANGNNGESPSTPWKGLHSTSSALFNPGDSLFLKRGCTWNWYIAITPYSAGPPAVGNFNESGGSGVFTIDAYGNGTPPTIQNEVAVPTASPATSWVPVSGHANVYAIAVYSPSEGTGYSPYRIDAVKLGGIWGNCVGMNDAANDDQYCGSTSAATGVAALTANGQWYYDGTYSQGGSYGSGRNCTTQTNPTTNPNGDCGNLYVYSSTGTPSNVTVTLDGAAQLLKIAGTSNITVQHLRLLNYSWYGMTFSGGNADYLTVANTFADTEVPFNFHGTGFYIYPEYAASHLVFDNDESHRGYYGFDFEPAVNPSTGVLDPVNMVQAASLTNCKSYFDRKDALLDNSYLPHWNVSSANVASGTLTVTYSSTANLPPVGSVVTFQLMANSNNTWLNAHTYTVLTSTSTQITASTAHGGYSASSESGALMQAAAAAPGTAVNYSYSHFYGNGVGSPIPSDVVGGVAGVGNIAPNTDPKVVSWANYTPRFTLQYRGPGYAFGSDIALNAQLPALGTAPLSIGIGTNYSFSASLIPQFNTWFSAGYDLNLMGLSAASYSNTGTLTILYTGTCTTTALTITGTPATSLAVVASGGTCPGGDSFTIPITSTMTLGGSGGLKSLLASHPNYTVAWVQPCGSCAWVDGAAMLAQDLAVASSAYVGPVGGGFLAPGYTVLLNPDQFLRDETGLSQAWAEANLTGWGSTWVYLYPGTLFSPSSVSTIEQDVSGTGGGSYQSPNFAGAVGGTTMQLGRDGLSGAFDAVASNGVDVQGLTTYPLSGWATLSPTALQQAIQAAIEKAAIWGVPQTLYWQSGAITNQQLSLVVADLQAQGATLMTDSGLVAFLGGKTPVATLPAGFCSCWAWTPETGIVNLRPTYLSPTVGAANGTVCASYPVDLNGVIQPQTWSATNAKTLATVSKTGCDIGAQALVPSFTGGLKPGH
jgi:hypothetical protein